MKKTILLLILIFPFIILGQKTMKGKYCSHTDFIGFCINFTDDSNFIYHSYACMGGKDGKGNYEINSKAEFKLQMQLFG